MVDWLENFEWDEEMLKIYLNSEEAILSPIGTWIEKMITLKELQCLRWLVFITYPKNFDQPSTPDWLNHHIPIQQHWNSFVQQIKMVLGIQFFSNWKLLAHFTLQTWAGECVLAKKCAIDKTLSIFFPILMKLGQNDYLMVRSNYQNINLITSKMWIFY